MDKAGWGDGPWTSEPDKEQWTDAGTGYACLLKRNALGALCGYVGVPQGHPWHGSDYEPGGWDGGDLTPALRLLDDVDVHGGLTYAAACEDGPDGHTICHVPAPGEPEPLWWLGFDCSHGFDLCPSMTARYQKYPKLAIPVPSSFLYPRAAYRDVAYVKAECARLAAVAAQAASLSQEAPDSRRGPRLT
jgi:hypothetical protein